MAAERLSVTAEAWRVAAAFNSGLLIGISSAEVRLHPVRCAQRRRRLRSVAHQVMQIVHEPTGQVDKEESAASHPIFLSVEVEQRDAALSIMRDDEQLGYGVRRKDEEPGTLYAAEMECIFHNTSAEMFYNFRTGMSFLFILRAIERIGDHAAHLAATAFYLLREGAGSATRPPQGFDEKRDAKVAAV